MTTATAHIHLDDAGVAWIDQRLNEADRMAKEAGNSGDSPLRRRLRTAGKLP